jgi:hypothetical protein
VSDFVCLLHDPGRMCCNCADSSWHYRGEQPIRDDRARPFCDTDCLDEFAHREATDFVRRTSRCAGCGLLGSLDGCLCGPAGSSGTETTPCPSCEGTGNRNHDVDLDDMVVDDVADEDCPDCGGTGAAGSCWNGDTVSDEPIDCGPCDVAGCNEQAVTALVGEAGEVWLCEQHRRPRGSSGTETPTPPLDACARCGRTDWRTAADECPWDECPARAERPS